MFCESRIFKSNFKCLKFIVKLRDVQLNMPPETKIDCERKKHLSISEKLAICNKEFAALHFLSEYIK
jgi:hypothetical protein